MNKTEFLYISVGFLVGALISFIFIDIYYQRQLDIINIQYRKDMEEMFVIPEIIIMENQTCPEVK